MKTIRRAIFLSIILLSGILAGPSMLLAGPTVPGFYGTIAPTLRTVAPTQLPVLKSGGLLYGLSSSTPYVYTANTLTINQNQSQAIIDWQSFNIGANASVYFNQQGNTSWVALNRIWDNSPSQIFGHLTADGQVYLINQNGILFAPGSQVNVHGLVASSLNLSIDNFLANTLVFNTNQGTMSAQDTNNNYIITDAELQGTVYANRVDTFYDQTNLPGTASNPGVVSNAGTIQTDAGGGGSVFLIGPTVENTSGGSIISPSGQIGLAAGIQVSLTDPSSGLAYPGGELRYTLVVAATTSGPQESIASNAGFLAADTGLVGMYGNIVNQQGLISSVTAVERASHVELIASDTITTGPGSMIALPVSDSPDKIDASFTGLVGDVTLTGANIIDLQGSIVAPSGYVTLNAQQRIYMAPGSLVDVSGLWVDEPATAALFQVQMNTYNLRDYYAQWGGILQGQNIEMGGLAGSAIGDVSGAFGTTGYTAAERHTSGGMVQMTVSGSGGAGVPDDIIVMQGAAINFSGGGLRYAGGAIDTTKLVSGYKVYDIASASAYVQYDSILNAQTFTNTRFGTTKTYNGIYYGGASPVLEYSAPFTVGSNAGTLMLRAGQVVLDGTILGFATNGLQQVMVSNPTNPVGDESAFGYAEAVGGTLDIGYTTTTNSYNGSDAVDFGVQSITVGSQTTPLPTSFQPGQSLPSSYFSNTSNGANIPTTTLSAASLSNAGLNTLSLEANTTVTVQPGAQITLTPGGTFNALARRIENYGGITVPGGKIDLTIQANATSDSVNGSYVPLQERIYLAGGSSLVASGTTVDQTKAAASTTGITTSGYTNGGSISILDQTVTGDGVIVSPGALIDVSGGYQIGPSGKVTGGDAGSLNLQGYAVVLNGDIRAYSLLGNKGGAITITTANVEIAPSPAAFPDGFGADSPLPQSLQGRLVLGADQLSGTGITNITLDSVNDVSVDRGVTIGPSLTKLPMPVAAGPTGNAPGTVGGSVSANAANPGMLTVTQDQIGSSSISLNAGWDPHSMGLTVGQTVPSTTNYPLYEVNTTARLITSQGSTIESGPGGAVSMTAPAIDLFGRVSVPGGTVTASATTGSLTLENGAAIQADGYNEMGTTTPAKGLPVEASPIGGGAVALTAALGNLTLSAGSLVSVSGSSPVQQTAIGDDGTLSTFASASQPGSIKLSSGVAIAPYGDLEGQAKMTGLPGGTLSLIATGLTANLSVRADDLARFANGGFDALTLASSGVLNLSNPTGTGQVAFGRSLTLDAPTITGSGSVSLSAPWVQVQAIAISQDKSIVGAYTLPTSSSALPGNASVKLTGTWLDVIGNVVFSGFSSVYLGASRDMTFADELYVGSYSGLLAVSGDLTLQAARIYPTTLSNFTVNAGGKATILPSGTTVGGPIYSAGGNLTVISGGAGIDQEGYLAAPMGTISLQATNGRVYLGSGSTTTTSGGDASVYYGYIDPSLGDNVWVTKNEKDQANPLLVQSAPPNSIKVNGSEVIVQNDAVLDVSGGGSVFTYDFIPSIQGTNDPLATAKTYVIVPNNSVVLPGNAVYLSGIKGVLPAGVYSELPEQYAFLPGAVVVTDLGTTVSLSKATLTKDGYPIVGGYSTTMGTGITSPQLEAFEVRPASVVLQQGDYLTPTMTAGSAGSVTLAGNLTTVVSGTIRANPLPGYSGGSVYMTASNIIVQESAASLPPGFGFDTPVPAGLAGNLTISAPSLSGQGFQTIGLGLPDPTNLQGQPASTIDIRPGTVLQAENIILEATTSITLESGAQVLALALPGDTGAATFITPNGTLNIGPNAVVHASNSVNIQEADWVLDPTATLKADHSTLNLQGSAITIYDPGQTSQSGQGTFLTVNQWNNLSSIFENISLTSSSDLVFGGSFTLGPVADTLTLDAGRIMDSVANSYVSLSAQTIALQNTTGAAPRSGVSAATGGQIAFNAPQMQVNQGSSLFDGFTNVNMNAGSAVTFSGVGSLKTNGGNLNITTPVVAMSPYVNSAGVYTVANYGIDTTVRDASGNIIGGGTVTMAGGSGSAPPSTAPGGTFAINAGDINIYTTVDVPSGQIDLTATGNITVGNNSQGIQGVGQILAQGTQYAPGGTVSLTSTGGGAINVASGALIDVSAYQGSGSQGDAGSISLYAPIGGVTLNGNVQGQAYGGKGGSLSIVTNTLDTIGGDNLFSDLNQKLAAGGFSETLNMEASKGDITIASGQTMTAQNVTLTTDNGSIILNPGSTIDVSSQQAAGGSVDLYAQQNLLMDGTINASGGTSGGNVTLWVGPTGELVFYNDSTINVSGQPGSASGGTVTFEAPLTGASYNQLNMSLNGNVTGASNVYAEAARTYAYSQSNLDLSTVIGTVTNDAYVSAFMGNSGNETQLFAGLRSGSALQHLQPSFVIENTAGDITLDQNWTLTNWRYSGEPGTLTLRAAGNLYIDGSIVDAPSASSYNTLRSSNAQPSWGINLVAGARTVSPDLLAVQPGNTQGAPGGSLTISAGDVVYTETGQVRFASSGDTVIDASPSNPYMITGMLYSLATYSGAIGGQVGGSLRLEGGAIQSATGSIDIETGSDLDLDEGMYQNNAALGTIRTTGESTSSALSGYSTYTTYAGGGSITLDVGGSVAGSLDPNGWLTTKKDSKVLSSPIYNDITPAYGTTSMEGIVAMAGGNVYVRTGGSFYAQTGAFSNFSFTTDAYLGTGGNLTVYSGGDIGGRFLVSKGVGDLSAMGNFGVSGVAPLIEMSAAGVNVTAQGSIDVGAVVNPNLAAANASKYWDNGYTEGSSVSFAALTGDVTMEGVMDPSYTSSGFYLLNNARNLYLPPNVAISAGRDIIVDSTMGTNYVQMPAADGELIMNAGRDIVFTISNNQIGAAWIMSDVDTHELYEVYLAKPQKNTFTLNGVSVDPDTDLQSNGHAPHLLHQGDAVPVTISAGRDIVDMNISLPKLATVTAGRNIQDLTYRGQNDSAADQTIIAAVAGNIVFGNSQSAVDEEIELGGPGDLVVEAGGKIDLGYSIGIVADSSAINPVLGSVGASVIVAAGFSATMEPGDVLSFFNSLRAAGLDYTTHKDNGDVAGAQAIINQERLNVIDPFIGSTNGGGGISLISSQISTVGGGDLAVLAAGSIDVGTTALPNSSGNTNKNTGMFTETGGRINVFSIGDVNVNEARMMTFQGGDITVWSDRGSINAGKGSKAAINMPTPTRVYDTATKQYEWTFTPPMVGSGIRAVTYQTNENVPAPPAGNIYLFAPQGVIDAGEAGIAGATVVLGATSILNGSNISSTVGSVVGLPASSQGVSLGALSGTSDLSKGNISTDTGALAAAQERVASAQPIEDMIVKWLDVKVMSYDLNFGAGAGPDDEGDTQDKKKKKETQE